MITVVRDPYRRFRLSWKGRFVEINEWGLVWFFDDQERRLASWDEVMHGQRYQ